MHARARLAPLAVFLLLVVPLVAFCAWRVPTGEVPDEPTHVMRAASLLHGEFIGHRMAGPNVETGGQDAGVTGNTGLALASIAGTGERAPLPAGASRAARLAWVRSIPWQPRLSFVSSANTAAYAPVTYIPAALGLGAAILMGAKPHAVIIGAPPGQRAGLRPDRRLGAAAWQSAGACCCLMTLRPADDDLACRVRQPGWARDRRHRPRRSAADTRDMRRLLVRLRGPGGAGAAKAALPASGDLAAGGGAGAGSILVAGSGLPRAPLSWPCPA